MKVFDRSSDELHVAASDAGIRVLRVYPAGPGWALVVPRRRDVWMLRLHARVWLRARASEMHVLAPELDICPANTRVRGSGLVTDVPDGMDPWLHHGLTWDVTVRSTDVPAVIARLGGDR